ncbi:MAG: DsbA family protein [Sphingobium sp.]
MTNPSDSRPDFRTAIRNRTIQMTIGTLIAATAGAVTAFAMQGSTNAPVTNRAQIEQIVHDYILEHPEILPQAMERLQAKRIGSAVEEKRSQLETPYAGAWEGAEKGDIILVEFFDYACGYCRASLPEIAKLVAGDKNLKVVYRELPILSEASGLAAHVSLLAAERGKYMAFHKALYDAGQVTRDSIFKAAASVGIDRKAAEAAMADKRYSAEVENNIKLAQAIGATGTPTFVIGNQVLAGAVGYDSLKEAIAKARDKAKKE